MDISMGSNRDYPCHNHIFTCSALPNCSHCAEGNPNDTCLICLEGFWDISGVCNTGGDVSKKITNCKFHYLGEATAKCYQCKEGWVLDNEEQNCIMLIASNYDTIYMEERFKYCRRYKAGPNTNECAECIQDYWQVMDENSWCMSLATEIVINNTPSVQKVNSDQYGDYFISDGIYTDSSAKFQFTRNYIVGGILDHSYSSDYLFKVEWAEENADEIIDHLIILPDNTILGSGKDIFGDYEITSLVESGSVCQGITQLNQLFYNSATGNIEIKFCKNYQGASVSDRYFTGHLRTKCCVDGDFYSSSASCAAAAIGQKICIVGKYNDDIFVNKIYCMTSKEWKANFAASS